MSDKRLGEKPNRHRVFGWAKSGPLDAEPKGRDTGGALPRRGSAPVHLLVDSTGLKLCGAGEWLLEKHGTCMRRSWRKLHIGVDADTGRIVAATMTARDVDDASHVCPLLDQVGPLASFTADRAYDHNGLTSDLTGRLGRCQKSMRTKTGR